MRQYSESMSKLPLVKNGFYDFEFCDCQAWDIIIVTKNWIIL